MLERKKTLAEIVSDRIKTFISENNYQPGKRLPSEKEIMDMLGVSRTIVREALKTLQSHGIIEIKQGVGIFVSEIKIQGFFKNVSPFIKLDKVKFKELIDTRIILELGAIELVIEHYHLDKIKKMSHWNDLILEKVENGEKPKNEDLYFHRSLFDATCNETYIQLSNVIAEYFKMNQLEEIVDFEDYIASYKEHKSIITLLINKETEKAKLAMKAHLYHLYDILHKWEENSQVME
ncbi:FadR/GntR family transcriptional regulator [Lederbergia lenta]|uniref:GntR family transcriptional regulator n=1 Tax=Lederbergia lenta TaxID=1467 RepID=A0A2X4ZSB8_LEDLE|nr:FadR/GntR family transcriptional regulator [Lederbergia lenta]SQI63214.1 GntR family transcriptional regulator [Lederbergia lenta]